jgi:hypothetical protein
MVHEGRAGQPLLRALLRGALLAVALGIPLSLLGLLAVRRAGERFEVAIWAFAVGFFPGFATWVELIAERRKPSWTRDLLAGAASLAFIIVGFVLTALQARYTVAAIHGLSLGGGLESSEHALDELSAHAGGYVEPLLVFLLPAAALAVTRLRRGKGLEQGAVLFLVTLALALAESAAWIFSTDAGYKLHGACAIFAMLGGFLAFAVAVAVDYADDLGERVGLLRAAAPPGDEVR